MRGRAGVDEAVPERAAVSGGAAELAAVASLTESSLNLPPKVKPGGKVHG